MKTKLSLRNSILANTNFCSRINSLPDLGVGLGLRREFDQYLFPENKLLKIPEINWLEIVPENYINIGGKASARLRKAHSLYPIISHGVNLSLGSSDELNIDYLTSLKQLINQYNIAWFSDHLCFTSIDGVYLHDLLPLPFNEATIKHIVKKIKFIQGFIEQPFLIENISYYMMMPYSTMNEAQFTAQILERADCGLLLDVNNVYVNAQNHNFDPHKFIDNLPLERVVQIHIAGHSQKQDMIIDTHGSPVIKPVYELLAYVLSKTKPKAILLERDQNFPPFGDIIDELKLIKQFVTAVPEI